MLAAAGKPPIKAVAEKDAANPSEADKQADVADAWWEASKQEKSPWKRQKMAQRSLHWLEKALPASTGLTQVRVVKRMGEVEEATTGAIDLLHLIDVKKDQAIGEWTFEGATLVSPQLEWARCAIPYVPPDEYDLTVVFTRVSGGDCVSVGLARGSATFAAVIDAHPPEGMAAFDLLDGTIIEKNPATVKGPFITTGKAMTAVYSVRKSGVTVSLDGKPILSFQGAFSRLTPSPVWKAKDPKVPLFIGCYGTPYRFHKITLLPVSGQGKKAR